MSERIVPPTRPRGSSAQALRYWGLLFLAIGIAGQTIIQNRMLGVGSVSGEKLFEELNDKENFIYATVAILAQLVQTCAIPIFCFLLVEGVKHTSSFKSYFLRVCGVALVSEIPYNLAMGGKLIDWNSRNPVIGLVLALVMIFLFKQFCDKSFKGVAIAVLVVVMAVFWVEMLRIVDGAATVILVAVLWFTRKKLGRQVFGGCVVMFLCMVISPLYFVAPMIFLVIHFYNGEPGEGNRVVNYLAYPVLLLGLWLVGVVAF